MHNLDRKSKQILTTKARRQQQELVTGSDYWHKPESGAFPFEEFYPRCARPIGWAPRSAKLTYPGKRPPYSSASRSDHGLHKGPESLADRGWPIYYTCVPSYPVFTHTSLRLFPEFSPSTMPRYSSRGEAMTTWRPHRLTPGKAGRAGRSSGMQATQIFPP